MRDLKAIILAAGKGTRLRPLTYAIPKPLLPIKGKPMLEWVLGSILYDDIDEVIVAVSGTVGENPQERVLSHIQGISIDSYVRHLDLGFKIRTIPTPMRETGGDLRFVLEEANIHKGKAVIVYGDNLTSFNFKEMVEYHDKCRDKLDTSCTVLLFKAPKSEVHRFGIAKLREKYGFNLVDYFIEKPTLRQAPSRYANAGYYIIEVEEVFDKLPRGRVKVEHSLFPQLASEGKLAGFLTKLPFWIDISTLEAYDMANRMSYDGLIIPPPLPNKKNN